MRGFLFFTILATLCGVALCVPVRLALSGAVETGSGRFCLTVRWLLFQTGIWFDLCVLDPPSMTVLIRHGRALTVRPLIGGSDGEKPRFTESLRRALKIKQLQLDWFVGIREDPALTAIVAGCIEQATRIAAKIYLPETADRLQITLQPYFDKNILRLTVRGIAIAFPAQIMHAWLKSRKKNKSGQGPVKRRSNSYGASD